MPGNKSSRSEWSAQSARVSASLLIFFLSAVVYLSNSKTIRFTDTIATAYIPASIITERNFDLDEFRGPHEIEFPMMNLNGHWYSYYPAGTALLAMPVYAVHRAAGGRFNDESIYYLEKYSAVLIMAASVVVIFLAAEKIAGIWISLFIAFVYAFATSSWSTSSQALWQHTSSQFFNSLVIYLLLSGLAERKYLKFAGLACSFAIVCRPTNFMVFIVTAIYVLYALGFKSLLRFLSLTPLVLGVLLFYNFYIYHNVFGGYQFVVGPSSWKNNIFEGLAGLTINPSRGIFVYSPVLILSLIGFIFSFRKKEYDFYKYAGVVCAAYILLFSTWFMWWGGDSYGPRMLADILPFMVILMVPALVKYKNLPVFTGTVVVLTVFSIWVQFGGAFFWGTGRDITTGLKENNTEKLWRWDDSQLLNTLKLSLKGAGTVPERKNRVIYPVSGMIKFDRGETERYFGKGWSQVEDWGTWAVGRKSELFFRFTDKTKNKLEIKALGVNDGNINQEMKVYFNGKYIKTCVFTRPLFYYCVFKIAVPPRLIKNGINEIKFVYKNVKRASYCDTRMISAGFKYIRFSAGKTLTEQARR